MCMRGKDLQLGFRTDPYQPMIKTKNKQQPQATALIKCIIKSFHIFRLRQFTRKATPHCRTLCTANAKNRDNLKPQELQKQKPQKHTPQAKFKHICKIIRHLSQKIKDLRRIINIFSLKFI